MTALRPELTPLPPRMARLPVESRGYPVPWFVEWMAAPGDTVGCPIGQGTPEFRVMSHARLAIAIREQRCWVCGQRLGVYKTFVIGPMCAINRVSGEPPSHTDCAKWSAVNCPFLARPHARRREAGMPERGPGSVAGVMIARNPGVTLLWSTKNHRPFNAPGGVLFDIGEPDAVSFWREGRPATRAEVQESIDTGLPALRDAADQDGRSAHRALDRAIIAAQAYLPAA